MVQSKSHAPVSLAISIGVIFAVWAIPDILGPDIAKVSSDLTYIALTVFLTVTAFFQVLQTRKKDGNRPTWIVFSVFALMYTAAQHIWAVNELIFDERPFPSLADVAFILDTACLILFFIMYVRPMSNNVSKKIMSAAVLPSIAIVVAASYLYAQSGTTESIGIQVLLFSYPFLDAVALVPAVIGIALWFRDRTNFPLLAICSSMVPLAIGDLLFQVMTQNDTYYTGSVADLFFYVQLDLLIFGVYYLSNAMRDMGERKA